MRSLPKRPCCTELMMTHRPSTQAELFILSVLVSFILLGCSSSATDSGSDSTTLVSAGSDLEIIFAGHIYPYNGNTAADHYMFLPVQGEDSAVIEGFIENANRLDPDLVILGGDSIRFSTAQSVEHLRVLTDRLSAAPVRLVPGNHDLVFNDEASRPELLKMMRLEPWSEDIAGVRLIYLNTVEPVTTQPLLSPANVEFLETALDGNYDVAIVFLHHSFWLADLPSTWVNSPYEGIEEREWERKILPMLANGRVNAVVAGDGGVRQPTLVSDICGIPHYVSGWSFDVTKRPAEMIYISVTGNEVSVQPAEIIDGIAREKSALSVDPPEVDCSAVR